MFDANASHIKCGEWFFAEIHSTDDLLVSHGISFLDIVLCKHIEKGDDLCERNLLSIIWAGNDSDPFEWTPNDGYSWMVYSGRPSGKGFIQDKWKDKALELLGGSWKPDFDI